MELANRVNRHKDLALSGVHREFLSILSKFYKTHRYGRYSLASISDIDAEKKLFLDYIAKHLGVDIDYSNQLFAIANTDQIKKFIGKVTRKITHGLYSVICSRARELRELCGDYRGRRQGKNKSN